MNIIDFIFGLLHGRLHFNPDEYDALKTRVNEDLQNAKESRLVKFVNSPYVLLLLPFLLPILKRLLDNLLNKWIGDEDEDGDVDVSDALAIISRKLLKQKI